MAVSKPSELHNLTLPRQHFGKISAAFKCFPKMLSEEGSSIGFETKPVLASLLVNTELLPDTVSQLASSYFERTRKYANYV